MARAGVLAVAALLLAAGCTSDPDDAPPASSVGPTEIRRVAEGPRVTRLPPALGGLPWADVGLPRAMPAGEEPMPDTLDARPTRALLAYHPDERWEDPPGWVGEHVLFLDAEGDWSRLELADLGFPAETWRGPDTYGAGELSPDGRTWVGYVGTEIAVLDLGTGDVRRWPGAGDPVVQLTWLPDSSRVLARSSDFDRHNHSSGVILNVADGSTEPTREPVSGFAADGTSVFLDARGGSTQLVRVSPGGSESRVDVARRLLRESSWVTPVVGGRFLTSSIPRDVGVGITSDLVAVDDRATIIARLRGVRDHAVTSPVTWLDDATLLTETSRGLVTWNATTGELRRVAHMHRMPFGSWPVWTLSVATDLLVAPQP